MKRAALGLVLLGAGLLWLSACNPGGGGTQVTVELVSPLANGGPATATVVYQVGDGNWQLATQTGYGKYAFTLPPGEKRYGVAVNCLPSIPLLTTVGWAFVYQLTTDDTTALKVACLNLSDLPLTPITLKAKKDTGDTGSYDRAWIFTDIGNDYDWLNSNIRLGITAGSGKDVLVVAYDGGYQPDKIRRIRFLRDFDASPGNCPSASPCQVVLKASDAPSPLSVDSFDTPADATDSFFGVGFVSKKGLVVPHGSDDPLENPALGTGDASGGQYFAIPNTQEGDLYYAEASAEKAGYRVGQVKLFAPTTANLSFELPDAWFDPSVEEQALPKFSRLNYHDPELVGYAFQIKVSDSFYELVTVSKGWLGSATSYTLPDLSAAPDFRGTRPLEGDVVSWNAMAVMMNQDLGAFLAADPLPLPNPVPRLPGLSIQLASKLGSYTVP